MKVYGVFFNKDIESTKNTIDDATQVESGYCDEGIEKYFATKEEAKAFYDALEIKPMATKRRDNIGRTVYEFDDKWLMVTDEFDIEEEDEEDRENLRWMFSRHNGDIIDSDISNPYVEEDEDDE